MNKQKIDTFVLVDLAETFGQVLKKHRTAAEFSQEELAHRAEMHSTTLSMYERGERRPTLHTVFILARALGIKPSLLVTEVEGFQPELD